MNDNLDIYLEDEYGNIILNPNDLDKLVNYLRGSSRTLDEALETLFEIDFNEVSSETLYELDELIFLCETCGWWYEISEMGSHEHFTWSCQDCIKDIERDEAEAAG